MQKYLPSVVFGLGQALSAASTLSHICNDTHAVYADNTIMVHSSSDAAAFFDSRSRLCGIEAMDIYGRVTNVTWGIFSAPSSECGHALCTTTGSGTASYAEGRLVLNDLAVGVRPSFDVSHVAASSGDIFVAGGRCVHSVSIQKTACVPDDAFDIVGIASDDDTVYVLGGSHGDVYAFHHVPKPSTITKTLRRRRSPSTTWQMLPAVPVASKLDRACLPRELGRPTGLVVRNNTLHRYFENVIVASALPPKTAANVWLPYAPASKIACNVVPSEPCPWYMWNATSGCRARRRCSAVGALPSANSDTRCKKRSRRQYTYEEPTTLPPDTTVPALPAIEVVSDTASDIFTASGVGSHAFASIRTFEGLITEDTCDANDFHVFPQLCPPQPLDDCRPDAAPEVVFGVAGGQNVAFVNAGLSSEVAAPISCAGDHFARSGQCLPCERCSVGTYLVTPCAATDDVVCAACKPGTYQPAQWHLERACHIANGCPGGDRTKNGVCLSDAFNYNMLWAMALPLYGSAVMVVKRASL